MRATVRPVAAADIESLGHLPSTAPWKPYRFLDLPPADLDDFWRHRLTTDTDRGGAVAAVADGCPVALAVFAPLPWESRVSGWSVYGLQDVLVDPSAPDPADTLDATIGAALDAISRAGGETVHCKRPARDVLACQALERAGFRLMGTQLLYGVDPARAESPPALFRGARIRQATPADVEPLLGIVRAGFQDFFGRFDADSRLSLGGGVHFYEDWIRSGLSGYADFTLLAECDGVPVGFSMWRRGKAGEAPPARVLGYYSLGAVHPDYTRRGLFTALTGEGVRQLPDADVVLCSTHAANHAAQRGFAKLGCHIVDAVHAFHCWF